MADHHHVTKEGAADQGQQQVEGAGQGEQKV